MLTGGSGNDYFILDSALVANRDRIADFNHASDTIWLENSIFKGHEWLRAPETRILLQRSEAHDTDDHILYNSANGMTAGSGPQAQIHFGTLANGPSNVSYNDFVLI